MATTFNLAAKSTTLTGGYTRTSRKALKDEALVKVKFSAVRKIIDPPFSSIAQITSFDPAHMKESSSFFNFIGGWRSDTMMLQQHVNAFYMGNVFTRVVIEERERLVGGAPLDPPELENQVIAYDDMFECWHNLTIDQVAESCRIYSHHAEDVDRQNLQWTWELILANVDPDLRHYIISEVDSYPPEIGQTGPMAFYVMASKIISTSSNLAHNVITGIMCLELKHFDGEDVQECVFVLRNVLKFLNYGHPAYDMTPPTIMDYLVDVFMRSSNFQFRLYLQQLRDFYDYQIDKPEKLFAKVQAYYTDILSKPGVNWLPVKKKKAVFVAKTEIKNSNQNNSTSSSVTTNSTTQSMSMTSSKFVVDRNPPGDGEPTTRTNEKTGREEHWCAKCPKGGRWGNHSSDGHEKWYKDFLESKKKKESSTSSSGTSTVVEPSGSGQAPESMSRANASVSAPVSSTNPLFRRTFVSFQDSDDESF